MKEKININQVEKLTGVSKRNIRFYEKEGLLFPKRNSENGYRVYDETEIWRIKVIKMLRMLDMPLEEIKKVLEKEQLFSLAVVNQQLELKRKTKELQAAIAFCEQLKVFELETLDVDDCLNNIERTGGEGFFKDWVEDYKYVIRENRDMDFSFVPDIAITNEREFTDALFEYANKENINLIIIKESMNPEFTIDGIEYTAERNYSYMSRVPIAVVNCHRKEREIKGEGVQNSRKNLQWFIHNWGGVLAVILLYCVFAIPLFFQEGFSWEMLLVFVGLLLTYGSISYRNKVLHFNDKTKL